MQTLKRENLAPNVQKTWDEVEKIIEVWNDKFGKSASLWAVEENEGKYRALALDLFDTYEAGMLYSSDEIETAYGAIMNLGKKFQGE